MKLPLKVLLVLLSSTLLWACGGDSGDGADPSITKIISITAGFGGQVFLGLEKDSSCVPQCLLDIRELNEQAYYAIADEGYEFFQWQGATGLCANAIANICTIKPMSDSANIANADHGLQAVFVLSSVVVPAATPTPEFAPVPTPGVDPRPTIVPTPIPTPIPASAPDPSPDPTNTVSGKIINLQGDLGLMLNGSEEIIVSNSASFSFPGEIPDNSAFELVISSQPMAQPCAIVANVSADASAGNSLDVIIECAANALSIVIGTDGNESVSADDTLDRIDRHTYDINGNRTSITSDTDNDGLVDEITINTYDANGNRTSVIGVSESNGMATSYRRWIYNAHALPSSYIEDDNGDNVADRIASYVYDEASKLVSVSIDVDANGVDDEINSYSYDVDGNRASVSFDENGDGTWNRLETFGYDEHGNNTSKTEDTEADGNIDKIWNYSYDINANRIGMSVDTNADGTWDETSAYKNKYDVNNRLISTTAEDSTADGVDDWLYTWTFDTDDQLIKYTEDSGADGSFSWIETWTYDGDTNRTSYSQDTNGDGLVEQLDTWSYDEDGNLSGSTSDNLGTSGTPDQIINYSYQGDLSIDYLH